MTEPLEFELLALFLADHAAAVNGKLYVNGGFFNRLHFPAYPAMVPGMSLVAVFRVPFSKYLSEHSFMADLRDEDGQLLPFKVQGSFRVGAGPGMEFGDPTVIPVTVPIQGLVIPRPGEYRFTFAIDGKELGHWSFKAQQVGMPLQFKLPPPPAPPESQPG